MHGFHNISVKTIFNSILMTTCFQAHVVPLWGKSLNVYWLGATSLAIWFLLIHTPPVLWERQIWKRPLFICHLMGACGIYIACIVNALWTPSTTMGQSTHVQVGRVGMYLGVVGVVTGFILTWTRIGEVGWGFGVPISIGGAFQLFAQWNGYRSIQRYRQAKQAEKELCQAMSLSESVTDTTVSSQLVALRKNQKKYLAQHIGNMLGVFVAACGIPAIIRLMADVEEVWPYVLVITGFNIWIIFYTKSFVDRMPPIDDPTLKATSDSPLIQRSTK